ncbi:hypothetical protein FXO37_09113 [Capsicum annuum]|nr:hypothetical protein FXO37_09113 [Capsicum annuum]
MCIVKLGELFFSLAVVNLLEFQFAFPTNIKDVEHSPLEIEVFPTAFNGLLVTGHGGAAITSKDKLETIDEENLKEVSSHLRQAFVLNSTSANVLGMDWSKRSGKSEAPSFVDDFGDQPAGDSESFIVVHGAVLDSCPSSHPTKDLQVFRYKRVFLPSECLHSHVVGQHAKELLEGEMKIIFKWIYCYIFKLFEKTKLFLAVKLFEIWQLVLLQMTKADISMVIKVIDSGFIPVKADLSECSLFSVSVESTVGLVGKDTRLKLEDLEAVARKAEIQGCEVCSAENKLQFFFPDILALHFFSYYAHLNGATFVQ